MHGSKCGARTIVGAGSQRQHRALRRESREGDGNGDSDEGDREEARWRYAQEAREEDDQRAGTASIGE
jgi:hypothetical protein